MSENWKIGGNLMTGPHGSQQLRREDPGCGDREERTVPRDELREVPPTRASWLTGQGRRERTTHRQC